MPLVMVKTLNGKGVKPARNSVASQAYKDHYPLISCLSNYKTLSS